MNKIKDFFKKIFGGNEYMVTAVSVNGDVEKFVFYNLKEVDELVNEFNCSKYWNIQKIHKYKRLDFKYKKIIIHYPLWFQSEQGETEFEKFDDIDYSFLLKDKSLKNIKREKK